MEKYKVADDKIQAGYQYLRKNDTIQACNVWLEAWEDIKSIMGSEHIKDVSELQKKYNWSDFLSNYVQDLEAELHNAGIDDKTYFHKRIKYCEEMLKVCRNEDDLIVENTRRAIADSNFYLGNAQECDHLYSTWLKEDPKWGWGYIGWSDCYFFGSNKEDINIDKAEEIIKKALEIKDIRDRIDVVDRAMEIYQEIGNEQKAAELKKELEGVERNKSGLFQATTPVKVEKIGRNEPCSCGSGKKYKKCCGK